MAIKANLAFGVFTGNWAWRVEWLDKAGQLNTQDFHQQDLRPGEAKAKADAFRESLAHHSAAA